MRIERQSREFDKKEMFKMANDNHLLMKNLPDDSIVNVTDYVRYTTDDDKEVAVFYHTDNNRRNNSHQNSTYNDRCNVFCYPGKHIHTSCSHCLFCHLYAFSKLCSF